MKLKFNKYSANVRDNYFEEQISSLYGAVKKDLLALDSRDIYAYTNIKELYENIVLFKECSKLSSTTYDFIDKSTKYKTLDKDSYVKTLFNSYQGENIMFHTMYDIVGLKVILKYVDNVFDRAYLRGIGGILFDYTDNIKELIDNKLLDNIDDFNDIGSVYVYATVTTKASKLNFNESCLEKTISNLENFKFEDLSVVVYDLYSDSVEIGDIAERLVFLESIENFDVVEHWEMEFETIESVEELKENLDDFTGDLRDIYFNELSPYEYIADRVIWYEVSSDFTYYISLTEYLVDTDTVEVISIDRSGMFTIKPVIFLKNGSYIRLSNFYFILSNNIYNKSTINYIDCGEYGVIPYTVDGLDLLNTLLNDEDMS